MIDLRQWTSCGFLLESFALIAAVAISQLSKIALTFRIANVIMRRDSWLVAGTKYLRSVHAKSTFVVDLLSTRLVNLSEMFYVLC